MKLYNTSQNIPATQSSDVSYQKKILKLIDDPIYAGFLKPRDMHSQINRVSSDFDIPNLELKLRAGSFTSGVEQLVELNVIGQYINTPFIAMWVVFGVLVACAVGYAIYCKRKITCNSTKLPITFTLLISIFLVLGIILTLLHNYLNKYSNYNLFFNRIPELVTSVNTSTAGITAVLPSSILTYNIQDPNPTLTKNLFTNKGNGIGQTIGQNWLKNHKIVKSTKLVDALKDNTNAVKKDSHFLSGGKDDALSDDFIGQLLCMSFISVIGDNGNVVTLSLPVPGGKTIPQWLSKQKNNTVFFDFGNKHFGTHTQHTLWGLCHQLVECNGAFPPCYAWVSVDKDDPCKTTLVAILVNGTYFKPSDAGWVCAKAIVFIQAFLLIEAMHLCMHKISELNAIAVQYSIPVTDSLYALMEPFTINAFSLENELSTLLITPKIETQMAFAFLTDIPSFKNLLPSLLTYMVSNEIESPCRSYDWWGGYQKERESIFKNCYSTLFDNATNSTTYLDAYKQELTKLCLPTQPSHEPIDPINVLKTVSMYHASATFTGARMVLNGFMPLALGMMQHGATIKTNKWRSWKKLLPTLGADDFTGWLVQFLSLGYTTGESDGPYLLDPDGYYVLTEEQGDILKDRFSDMVKLGEKLYKNTKTCDFKPSWYYSPTNSAKSMTTMTSGTYI